MNAKHLFFAVLICFSLGTLRAELPQEELILKKGGPDAAIIIDKARNTLSLARVFASRGVGESGVPTASCWALTVIVRYDPEAKEFFDKLMDSASGYEVKMYAVVGLLELDPTAKARFAKLLAGTFPDQPVHAQFGCMANVSTYGIELYNRLENGTGSYLFEKLPSLYQTVEVERF